jgi:hypothetical protein
VQFLVHDEIGSLVDGMTFAGMDWRTVDVGNDHADQLVDMGIIKWFKEPKKELELRKFQTSGCIMVSADTYQNVWLSNRNGAFPLAMCFPYDSPLDGRAFYAGYEDLENVESRGDVLDLPFPGLPMSVDTEEGMQPKFLAIVAERALFQVETEMIPMLVTKERFGSIIGDEGRSVGTFSNSEFTEMSTFRY